METVWVLGDQLSRSLGAIAGRAPGSVRVLMVESRAKIGSKRWHRQRLHLVLTSMRRFAEELLAAGFEVDYRHAATLRAGLSQHRERYRPPRVWAMEPASLDGRALLERLGVELVRSNQFLTHPDEFAAWAAERARLRMEDFYRWQRQRFGYLMDGDEPAGGRWNFDRDNRKPPPTDGRGWPEPLRTPLDDLDREVIAALPDDCVGASPTGIWPTSRHEALRRLDHAIAEVLPRFGPHEDAMLSTSWHLAHTLLSAPLNLGLLHPREVCDRIETAYRAGEVPIASAEGLLRQVLGWREYVWGVYWLWGERYRSLNELQASRPLPPAFVTGQTGMRCLAHVLADIHRYGWTHHIQRLMVLSNLCLLAGVRPQELVEWMWATFVDGAEWVMLPNVLGMGLHADGSRMATKPYAAGGNYVDRMSDYCAGCRYDHRARTGDTACPLTTLYWDFLDRHRDRFERNPRMGPQVRGLAQRDDLAEIRTRATQVLELLDRGEL
jgi:deoxyribodipyrimidine photolyase-related protein